MSKASLRVVLLSVALSALSLSAGCELGVYEEPEPVGPIVYDSYYWNGYYDGAYWVYRDPGGHIFRELRADHEGHLQAGYRGAHVAEHRAGPVRGPAHVEHAPAGRAGGREEGRR